MKRAVLVSIGALLLAGAFACSSFAQGIPAPGIAPFGQIACSSHKEGTLFLAPCYATWQGLVLSGNAATGSQTIIIAPSSGAVGGMTLADGAVIPLATIFTTNMKLYIGDANAETVTPTAVSIGFCPVGFLGVGASVQCATVTATFANTHGASALVYSGDAGIEEAIADAGNSGGGSVYWAVDTGIVTLTTSGLTTTTTTFVPTTFYPQGCAARVSTTITVTASWAIGISGATSGFCAAQSTLTAGTTGIPGASTLVGTGSTALTALLITGATSNPGAGALKARAWGFTPVQPLQ